MNPQGNMERAKQHLRVIEDEIRDGGQGRANQYREKLQSEMHSTRKQTLLWLLLLLIVLLAIGFRVVWHP